SAEDPISAHPQHDQKGRADQELEQRLEQSGDAHELNVVGDVILIQAVELSQLRLLLRIGADHAHTGETLLHAAADVGKHGLYALEAVVDLAAEKDDGETHQGRGKNGQKCEAPIGRPHHHDGQDEGEAGLGPIHDAGTEHHADGVEVVGGAGHDVAGAMTGVEITGEIHQMRKQIVAQVELDVAGNADQ